MKPRPRVIIADDDALIVEQLSSLIEPSFDVVGCASNGRRLVEMVEALLPAIVIADITMPEMNGIEATRLITKKHPAVKVVIVSGHTIDALIAGAFDAGASGYVAKLQVFSELIPAMDTVLSGDMYWPRDTEQERTRTKYAAR